jgi:hypothetical protein
LKNSGGDLQCKGGSHTTPAVFCTVRYEPGTFSPFVLAMGATLFILIKYEEWCQVNYFIDLIFIGQGGISPMVLIHSRIWQEQDYSSSIELFKKRWAVV